jgi:hypothetical protein
MVLVKLALLREKADSRLNPVRDQVHAFISLGRSE